MVGYVSRRNFAKTIAMVIAAIIIAIALAATNSTAIAARHASAAENLAAAEAPANTPWG